MTIRRVVYIVCIHWSKKMIHVLGRFEQDVMRFHHGIWTIVQLKT